jgi:hypothetical protein
MEDDGQLFLIKLLVEDASMTGFDVVAESEEEEASSKVW